MEVDAIPATSLSTQIHLQALGAELMATIRPDNVMHPHLRAHVEFMLGLFASVHLARGDSADVLLSEYLLGCGIQVEVADLSEPSWIAAIADAYNQRHENPVSVVRPMCHTSWGEKVRNIEKRLWYHESWQFHHVSHHLYSHKMPQVIPLMTHKSPLKHVQPLEPLMGRRPRRASAAPWPKWRGLRRCPRCEWDGVAGILHPISVLLKRTNCRCYFFHDKKKMKMKIMMMMMMIEPSGRFMKKRKLCYNQLIQHGWGIPQKMEVPSWEHPKKFGIFIKHCEPEIPSGKLA